MFTRVKNKPFTIVFVLLFGLLVACGSSTEATPPAEVPTTESPQADGEAGAVAAARAALTQELGVAESEIELVAAEMTEFSDSCLGLGQPNESCLQAITPGWLITLSVQGQTYEVHTDETGEQVRIAG